MKIKKIVGFGDSWMWGDELLDPTLKDHPHAHPVLMENTAYREGNCFLGLLGKTFDLPTVNFGWPGASLQSAIWCYLWWLEHEELDPSECLILVSHTDANRTSFYNPGHVSYANDPPWNRFLHSSWVHAGCAVKPEWETMIKQYTVLSDCHQLHRLNYQQSVYFFQGQSCIHGNNLLQFCSIRAPMMMQVPGLLWPETSLAETLKNTNRPELLAPMGHASELGNKFIHDRLLPHVESVILA